MAGFRKAERKKAKLRLALAGPSGSGKTASALLIAYGITGDWEKIGVVDTENGSGELYVGATIGGVKIGDYNALPISSPYTPDKYIQGIKLAEQEGIEVVILDSLTHAWSGEGGLLDQQGKIAQATKNSWTAWREVTPKHNALVEALLRSKIHVIATMRSKQEHVQEKDERTGKTVVKKVGMAPIQRDGMEYEFTSFFDISVEHIAWSSKDRTNLFDGQYFKPSPETGKLLLGWLDGGIEASVQPPAQQQPERKLLKPTDKPKVSGAEYKQMAQESENALDRMSSGGNGIDAQLHCAWDVLGTPDNKRKQQFSKPNLDKEGLLNMLNEEVERRRKQAGQPEPEPEQETPQQIIPPPQAAVAAVGAFF